MALRVIVLILSVLLIPEITTAQESVKRSIFQDCEQARTEFINLSVAQQASLFDFFTRVVALNTESPSAPEAYAVAPGGQLTSDSKAIAAPRGAEMIPGTLWQSMDAKRELRAKKCALELLELAGPLALTALPSLVSTYSEQALSDEVAVNVEEVSAAIAEAAHLQGRTLDTQQITQIVPHAFGQRPIVARNLIHEFKQEALPYLLSLIATRKEQLLPDMQRYLQSIDPDGGLALRATINLIPGLTTDQTQHLIGVIPIPTHQAWPGLIQDLVRLSANPNSSKIFIPLLGQACLALDGMAVDQASQVLIAAIPHILETGVLSVESMQCLMQSSSSLGRKIVEGLCDSTAENRGLLLRIYSGGMKRSQPEIRSEAYSCLRRMALDQSAPLWRESLLTLAAFADRRADTLAVVQQLSKTALKPGASRQSDDLRQALLELLQAIPLGKEYSRFSTFINQSLRSSSSLVSALSLARQALTVDPIVLALALTTPPNSQSILALDALSTRRDIPQRSLPQLIELLKYAESSLAAERAILSLGKQTAPALRKSISRLPAGAPRLSAFGLLIALETATKAEAYNLAKGLNEHEDCSFIANRSELFCLSEKISDYVAEDPSLTEQLGRVAQRCLPALKKDALTKVIACAEDLIFKASDAVGSMCRLAGIDGDDLRPLIELATQEIKSESQQSASLVAQMLLNCPPPIQKQILSGLTATSIVSKAVRDALHSISLKEAAEGAPMTELLRALAYIGDTHYPWREYVKNAINAASQGRLSKETAEVIAIIPVDEVLAEVMPALESEGSEQLIGAALVGAALGANAIPLVSRLWHLRTMRTPGVRYTSSLALLQINPLTPDLHDTVRRALVNRFFETALSMPIRWSNTVAVNDLASGTFGTLRREHLQLLLSTK